MTGYIIEAFLRLFCITDSSHSSWQSWTVLCICLVSAIATASSGSYFQTINAVKSSLVCYIVSTLGFSMALVTLLAILIGWKRRRRIVDPEAPSGEHAIFANPVTPAQTTSIEIVEDSSESQSVEQMWMNPVFAEYDKSPYEGGWNKKNNEMHDEKDNDTDFEDRDSDYFRSSSETMTWSYKSYSEDEGYSPHSSKESNVKEAGKSHQKPLSVFQETLKYIREQDTSSDLKEADLSSLKHHRDQRSMPQEELENSSADSFRTSAVLGSDLKQHFSNYPRNSGFRSFQVLNNQKLISVFQNNNNDSSSSTSCYETEIIPNDNSAFVRKYGLDLYYDNEPEPDFIENENVRHFHDGTLTSVTSIFSSGKEVANEEQNGKHLINRQELQNGYLTHTFTVRNELSKKFEENENTKYQMHNEVSKSSPQCNECHILSNSAKELSTVAKVDHTQATESSVRENSLATRNFLDSTLSHKACPTIIEMSHSNLCHQEKLAKNHSINKFDYPSLPYPKFDDYSNFEELEREEFYVPRYVKRPLLDINGKPICQKELVNVITKLLISGLPNIPKSKRATHSCVLYKMVFILTTTHLSSFPMGWECFSIAVAVVLIWSMVFCADCFGRWSTSRIDNSDTNSQRSTNIPYDITAPDTVDLNEYDILNHGDVIFNNERDVLRNDNVPNYASNNPVDHQPCPQRRSRPIPIPPRHKEPIDKYRLVVYANTTTADSGCFTADDIYRRENTVTFVSSEDSAIEIPRR
ncbi:hypothetical protein JTE90_029076 [Oedothorax gibbosus]|uniref:Uncharacterized protein n=1 Tax=Oedothorax gibbosus TaxID=931172 RepID=A0AAV6UUL8_9ARAC|nr:hypothetical protein JTE90_029076 [Oedothorax gibbosus]